MHNNKMPKMKQTNRASMEQQENERKIEHSQYIFNAEQRKM